MLRALIQRFESFSKEETGAVVVLVILISVAINGCWREFRFYKKCSWDFTKYMPRLSGRTGYMGLNSKSVLPIKFRIFVLQPLVVLMPISWLVYFLKNGGLGTIDFRN
jgi:hypothetical protein